MKNFHYKTLFFIISFVFFTHSILFSQSSKLPEVKLGIIQDGTWENGNEIQNLFKQEVNKLFEGEYNIRISKSIDGGYNLNDIHTGLKQLLNDDEVDIVIAGGEISTRLAIFTKELPKPTIATIVFNAEYQNMPMVNGKSGKKNLCYITFNTTLQEEISTFKKLSDFNRITVLTNELYFQSLENESIDLRGLRSSIVENVEFDLVPVGEDIESVLININDDTEAVMLTSLYNLSTEELKKIANNLTSRKIPTFSINDDRTAEHGILMSSIPKNFHVRLVRRIALNIQSILMGEEAGNIPVTFPFESEYVINLETAKKLKLYPSWSLLANATVIKGDPITPARKLSFFDAIKEAMESNLSIKSKEIELLSSKEDVRIARSNLLPQLTASGTGLLIDKERAESSAGQQAEKTISGGLALSQVLYDERAWSNLDITNIQKEIIEYENEQTKLDVVQAVATAYLNVIQSKANQIIQKDNLKNSISNLEIAQYRNDVGTAGPSEIYRWQSEIALSRRSVIEAKTQRNLAEMELNRILNRPLEEDIDTKENKLEELVNVIQNIESIKYFENKWYFKIFRKFMVKQAFKFSPELKIIDSGIEIQKRVLTSSKNSLYLPSIALQAEVNNNFYRGGEGSEVSPIVIPGLGTFSLFSEPEKLNWNVAVGLSLPLYSGGLRYANIAKSDHNLRQLKIDRKLLKDNIEYNVRAASHLAGSSYAGMKEAEEAELAANKNLDLVVKMYSEGAITITQLIDAQYAALAADLNAVNAKYTFIRDVMNMQRAVGIFLDLLSKEDQDMLNKNLNEYFNKRMNK